MGIVRDTICFVLLPIFVVMLVTAVGYHLYGYASAEKTAQEQLDSAAELASRLVERHADQVDQALEAIVVQGYLHQYHTYSKHQLLDEAEDARLWIEQALERLARSNSDVHRIDIYAPDGIRFVSIAHNRRELRPMSARVQPWFQQALSGEDYFGFSAGGRLLLAQARVPEGADSPIAVVAIEFEFREAVSESTDFAMRHLDDVRVSIVDGKGTTQFQHGYIKGDANVLLQETRLDRFESTMIVEQNRASAMSAFYRGRSILFTALAVITVGLLAVAAYGTRVVVRDLRIANQRIDQANRDLSRYTEELEAAHHALAKQTKALQSEQELLKQLFSVQERDRQLVAYEIHDGIVQYATGALMLMESCISGCQDPGRAERMKAAAEQLRKIIEEGRRLMNGLRPPILDESGVIEAIGQLLNDERSRTGLTVAFTHDVNFDRLDSRLEGAIFRIVQEALNNVRRHGKTDHAAIQMKQRNGTLEVVVRDQGVGFDPGDVRLESFGLRGIRERARLFGGDATIDSSPGEGTLIHVTFPTQAIA